MNRRGFFAALVAAPLAAVAGLRPKPRFDRIWKMLNRRARAIASTHYGKSPTEYLDDYMPKTKPFIEEQWRRYAEALRKDT